jgi:zinc-ribbon domain
MFCTNCGTKVVEGSAHCTSCGTRVEGVGAAAAIVSNVAATAYASLDANFKKSLFLGGGSMFASILTILLAGPAPILLILLIPATIILGIMALNEGRDLANKAGYYLGMIGLVAGTSLFYTAMFGYAAKSMAESAVSGMMGRMM